MARAKTTMNHDEIRDWVEARGGLPARVRKPGRGVRAGAKALPAHLRIDFPGLRGAEPLEHIGWDDWFDAFESGKLAFLLEGRLGRLVARPRGAVGGRAATTRRVGATVRTIRRGGRRATPKRRAATAASKRTARSTTTKRGARVTRTSVKRGAKATPRARRTRRTATSRKRGARA